MTIRNNKKTESIHIYIAFGCVSQNVFRTIKEQYPQGVGEHSELEGIKEFVRTQGEKSHLHYTFPWWKQIIMSNNTVSFFDYSLVFIVLV